MKLHSTESHSYSDFLTEFNQQIRTHIESTCSPIDLDTYECGINTWFGPGSVSLYELGLTLGLTHNSSGTTLTIE